MAVDPVQECIRLYAKQLKVPTFAEYGELLRQCGANLRFEDLLLELMKQESASRQENQNRRRLKNAGFHYLKTIDEFDTTALGGAVSQIFIQELASCQFNKER